MPITITIVPDGTYPGEFGWWWVAGGAHVVELIQSATTFHLCHELEHVVQDESGLTYYSDRAANYHAGVYLDAS